MRPWGEIFVNGASRGISPPVKRLTLPEGTYRIEDPIGPFWLDSKTWCYPVGPDFEELANSLSLGTIVDVSWEDVYPPVPE